MCLKVKRLLWDSGVFPFIFLSFQGHDIGSWCLYDLVRSFWLSNYMSLPVLSLWHYFKCVVIYCFTYLFMFFCACFFLFFFIFYFFLLTSFRFSPCLVYTYFISHLTSRSAKKCFFVSNMQDFFHVENFTHLPC